MNNVRLTAGLLLAPVLVLVAALARADDWPQWRGPKRDGHSKETGLLKAWPKDGPKLIWQVKDLGSGYSTPSVVGGRVYVFANKGLENEFVTALDANDGSLLWATRIAKVGNPEQQPNYPAARSSPTVDGAVLYALGSDGDLVSLDTATGKVRWRKSLRADFGGQPGTWAYAESPLVDGDMVVVTPGGAEATIVALNKNNGEAVWKCAVPGGARAGYSSIVVAEAGGVRQYVSYTGDGLVGVEAKTGRFLWRYGRTSGPQGMSILTPVVNDSLVYSANEPLGGAAVRIVVDGTAAKVDEVYRGMKLPRMIGGAVLIGGRLYGASGMALVCADFKTGEVKWSERSVAPGAVAYADGRLYLHGESGEVALVEATPDGYREHGRFTPPNPPDQRANRGEKAWAYPVIANGRLYVRDADSLWCYDLKAAAAGK
ncbi:MAG: PQQ-like beta-propeller repeat protein [Acidobacteria bacterium]|nr:PQQ-like beta-propeller repeat protein [Acidobacteriota bacterium]